MASPTAEEDRLDALDAEIAQLDADLLVAQRRAGDLPGDDHETLLAEAEAKRLEWRLKDRLLLSVRLNRAFRKSKCSAHGPALHVTCPECQIAWRYQARVA